ncbi:unnamed protein product [Brassica rapa]|uniref:Uncharacterized protein n=1 Tax=Brassica campestris TaxID=3711 RepID=A0A8D9HYR0_BRACM|nr:unnamed protein product [Brassica rapa]
MEDPGGLRELENRAIYGGNRRRCKFALDCIRKCNFILHNHNNTKTFHTFESDVERFGT